MIGPEPPSIPPHEGRLLQLVDDVSEASAVPITFLKELNRAASGASALFTDNDLLHHATSALSGHSNRSDFTQTADLKQHELAMDEAIRASDKAARQSHTPRHQSGSDIAASDASTTASTETAAKDRHTGADHARQEGSQAIGYTSGKDILGLVGLSAASDPTTNASQPDSAKANGAKANGDSSHHVVNGTHDLKLDPGFTLASIPPAAPVCAIHPNLPIPGMDIAPANKDRCYAHPHIYKNNNCLNDSDYTLYHHDIPTTHPHPAFTWGDISRFAQVSHKMRSREPVTVTFVGGSVSSSYCKNPSVTCWVAPVSAWLRGRNPAVQIINNAVGGTTSRTTAECFDAMVGKDADLIFLEYSYNDRWVCAMQ